LEGLNTAVGRLYIYINLVLTRKFSPYQFTPSVITPFHELCVNQPVQNVILPCMYSTVHGDREIILHQ